MVRAVSEALFVLSFAFLNLFRGRGWVPGDRILACAGFGLTAGAYFGFMPVGIAVAFGTFFWAVWGWSFEEITGEHDPAKYHSWIRRAGIKAFPLDGSRDTNRVRGVLMKALRGLYLYPTFVALSLFATPWSLLIGLGSLLQGPVYYLAGKLVREEKAVPLAEWLWGACMGGMIVLALITGGGNG